MVDQSLLERVTHLPRPERVELFDALRHSLGEAELHREPSVSAYANATNEVQPWPQFDIYDKAYQDSLPQRWGHIAKLWSKLSNDSEQYK